MYQLCVSPGSRGYRSVPGATTSRVAMAQLRQVVVPRERVDVLADRRRAERPDDRDPLVLAGEVHPVQQVDVVRARDLRRRVPADDPRQRPPGSIGFGILVRLLLSPPARARADRLADRRRPGRVGARAGEAHRAVQPGDGGHRAGQRPGDVRVVGRRRHELAVQPVDPLVDPERALHLGHRAAGRHEQPVARDAEHVEPLRLQPPLDRVDLALVGCEPRAEVGRRQPVPVAAACRVLLVGEQLCQRVLVAPAEPHRERHPGGAGLVALVVARRGPVGLGAGDGGGRVGGRRASRAQREQACRCDDE